MTDATGHLPYWTLEQLAEGGLSHVERTLAEQHLARCTRCSAELEGARALIASLEALPALEPSPRFADLVMARVAIVPQAVPELAAAPPPARPTRRWMMVLAMVLAPLPVLAALGAWFGGSPVAGMGALFGAVRGWARDVAWNLVSEGTETLIRTGLFQWGADTMSAIPGPTLAGVPVLLLLLAAAVPFSAWAMARMLRAPATGMIHA